MRLLTCFVLYLPIVYGEQLQIPFIQSAISAQLAKYSRYTSYNGPTGTATAALEATSVAAPKVKVNAVFAPKVAVAAVVATTPSPYTYWYEVITHQGKAAFNTNTSYTVFRNVKSYGAKG